MNRRNFLKYCIGASALSMVLSYPIFIEGNTIEINRYRIATIGLPKSFQGFRIVQITDIHLSFLTTESFVQGIVKKVNDLKANLIVCTGDFVYGANTKKHIDRVWPIVNKLKAEHGVLSVLGNHDYYADFNRSLYWLERTEQNIRHKCKSIFRGKERIVIGGAGDYWTDDLRIDSSFSSSDENDCRILLSHNPDSIDSYFNTPIALMLSGHTHGGQVVIPALGPIMLPVKNKTYSSGLFQVDNSQLFISKGIGWSHLPARLNCYPEIAIIELIHQKKYA